MTANQIAYQRLQEEERTHKANEDIGRQQAAASSQTALAKLADTEVNRTKALVEQMKAAETARHNVATERQASKELEEKHRSNKVNEGVAIANTTVSGVANILKGVGSIIPG